MAYVDDEDDEENVARREFYHRKLKEVGVKLEVEPKEVRKMALVVCQGSTDDVTGLLKL